MNHGEIRAGKKVLDTRIRSHGNKILLLQVISNRMQKSVLVAIDRLKTIKKYQTTIKRTTKLMVRGGMTCV